MSADINKQEMDALTRSLVAKWHRTRGHWRDAKRGEFERKYIDDLIPAVRRALSAMEQLQTIISAARTDCE